jgi:putative hydrolase of the HAD superfamily
VTASAARAQLHVDHGEREERSVIRAVFFDLDGTLVDSDAARDAAVSAMFPDRDVTGLWRDLEDRHFNAYLAGEISHADQRRRRVADLHAALDRPAPSDWFATYLREYERAWIPFPDALPTLAGLDLNVGVLTNGRMDQQHAKLKATGLRDHVKALLTSHELGVAKPAPEAFHAACQTFCVRPDEVMYVGDRLDVDARPAIAAGLRGVWLNRHTADQPGGVATITSLLQLPHLIDIA